MNNCTLHKEECTPRKEECTLRMNECTLQKECTLHKEECTLRKEECTPRVNECTLLKEECTLRMGFPRSTHTPYSRRTLRFPSRFPGIFPADRDRGRRRTEYTPGTPGGADETLPRGADDPWSCREPSLPPVPRPPQRTTRAKLPSTRLQ